MNIHAHEFLQHDQDYHYDPENSNIPDHSNHPDHLYDNYDNKTDRNFNIYIGAGLSTLSTGLSGGINESSSVLSLPLIRTLNREEQNQIAR